MSTSPPLRNDSLTVNQTEPQLASACFPLLQAGIVYLWGGRLYGIYSHISWGTGPYVKTSLLLGNF